METDVMIAQLRRLYEAHKNDCVLTFQTNWADVCKDTANRLEEQERKIAELTETVKQKEGHWIVLDNCSNAGIYCSQCDNKIFDYPSKPKKKLSNYCPNCGSRNEQFYNPSTHKYMNG